jgi:general stress protein CsbA
MMNHCIIQMLKQFPRLLIMNAIICKPATKYFLHSFFIVTVDFFSYV